MTILSNGLESNIKITTTMVFLSSCEDGDETKVYCKCSGKSIIRFYLNIFKFVNIISSVLVSL